MIRRIDEFDETEALGRDPELAQALSALDPASDDPNYWLRFHWWVMSNAARELARRRLEVRLTVGDVLEDWARALVPTAALVAVLAGLLLLRSEPVRDWPPIGVEELLLNEVEARTAPVDVNSLSFAADIF